MLVSLPGKLGLRTKIGVVAVDAVVFDVVNVVEFVGTVPVGCFSLVENLMRLEKLYLSVSVGTL